METVETSWCAPFRSNPLKDCKTIELVVTGQREVALAREREAKRAEGQASLQLALGLIQQ